MRVAASHLARRIAVEKRLDLSTLTGTGPYGRIVKAGHLGQGPHPKFFSK